MPGQRLPFGWRVAKPESPGIGELEAARRQEVPPRQCCGSAQLFGVELRRCLVRLDQPSALRLLLARDMAALLVPELDPGPVRQPLYRLRETEVVDLPDELDDVAALVAGEAVPQPPGWRDVERGRLFVMERAQALQRASTCAAELQILPYDLVDGRALPHQRDVLVADPACHLRPSARSAAEFRPAAQSRPAAEVRPAAVYRGTVGDAPTVCCSPSLVRAALPCRTCLQPGPSCRPSWRPVRPPGPLPYLVPDHSWYGHGVRPMLVL